MTDTPIDRESVEVLAQISSQERDAFTAKTLLALRAALDAAEAEIARLNALLNTPQRGTQVVLPMLPQCPKCLRLLDGGEASHECPPTARAALQENPDGNL